MWTKSFIFMGVFLLTTLGGAANAEVAHSEHQHQDATGVPALKLNQGEKWATDESLRSGMTAIRTSLQKDLKAIHENKLKAAQYRSLSDAIDPQVASIFKNCKLAPAADEMLHIVLAQIMGGLNEMKGPNPVAVRQKGALQIVHALSEYAEYFEHPGFKALP